MSGHNLIRMEGRRFGALTVLRREGRYRGYASWRCFCDCGIEVVVPGERLRTSRRKACNVAGHFWRPHRTHGESRSAEYTSWHDMRNRCSDGKKHNFMHYGGRGIAICERWKKFENFLTDMGRKPSPKHTLERRDNNRNYEPSNCRWATRAEQSRNYRHSVYVTYKGVRGLLLELCEYFGLSYSVVSSRLRLGWSLEKAMATPTRSKKRLTPGSPK